MSGRSSPVMRVLPFELWTRSPPPCGASTFTVSSRAARSLQGMPEMRPRRKPVKPPRWSSSSEQGSPRRDRMALVVPPVVLAPALFPFLVLHRAELPPHLPALEPELQLIPRGHSPVGVALAAQIEPADEHAAQVPDVAHVARAR